LISKNRGITLRVATVLHLLFSIESDSESTEVEVDEDQSSDAWSGSILTKVSDRAIKAAINFVKVTSQHTAFIVGKGKIEEELLKFQPTLEGKILSRLGQ
jgi:hypothetical protein